MTDNLRLTFDYKYPDTPCLVLYEAYGGYLTGEPSVQVKRVWTGERAIHLYSEITGAEVKDIHKAAGCTENNMFGGNLR